MQPVVEAAWIAAGAGVLGIIGTVTVAISGFHNTRKVTDQTIRAAAQNSARAREAAREDWLREKRADAYAAFMTQARAYRTGLRSLEKQPELRPSTSDLDALAAAADGAASLVFMVLGDRTTYDACRTVVRQISYTQNVLRNGGVVNLSKTKAALLNKNMAELLRKFQVAARNELGVSGIEDSVILTRHQVSPEILEGVVPPNP